MRRSDFHSPMSALRRRVTHPSRSVVLLFLVLILVGTLVLRLSISVIDAQSADRLTALFAPVSAVCVTGLVVVATGTYWSPFVQAVVLLLFQFGGFGLMTAAALPGIVIGGIGIPVLQDLRHGSAAP